MTNWLYAPEFSGAALQCHRLSLQLAKMGAEVEVLAGTDRADLVGLSEVDGILVNRVLRNKSTLLWRLHYAWEMFDYIVSNRARYDLLHSHGFLAPVNMAAKITGLPLVQKITNLQIDDPMAVRRRPLGALQFYLYSRAWVVVATSRLLADTSYECLEDCNNVIKIPNGVDTSAFMPADTAEKSMLRKKYAIPDDKVVLLTVGTISPSKGLDSLIRALYVLRQSLKVEPLLLVVGPSSYQRSFANADPEVERFSRWVLKLVDDYGLRNAVRFEGSQPAVHEYMKAADIYIHPSRREGQPNSLLEAMACGLPSVANLIPGITDEVLQSGKFGYLVNGEETDLFAAAIKVLINNPTLRARLGQSARAEILGRYDLKLVADRYKELYEQLVSDNEILVRKNKMNRSIQESLAMGLRKIEQRHE
jgi:glycosyltransferase involved in cell wall biosynthesis